MYYNVVVNDGNSIPYCGNSLVFHFFDDKDGALEFAKKILEISDYHIEIIPIMDGKEQDE